jgi:hypothetical protein
MVCGGGTVAVESGGAGCCCCCCWTDLSFEGGDLRLRELRAVVGLMIGGGSSLSRIVVELCWSVFASTPALVPAC